MNPWTILAWVAALAISTILITLAAAAVINIIRSIRTPSARAQTGNAHPIYRGPNHDA